MRAASVLSQLDAVLTRVVEWIGRAVGWLLLLLMAIIIFDVVTRRFLVLGSSRMQEMEWHIHAVIFALSLGYAFLADSHVRIELVRDRLSERTKAWIEIIGVLFLLLPFALVTIFYGIDFAATSFAQGESSPSPAGLPHRWIIKSVIPIGMLLLFLGGIVVLLRNILFLTSGTNSVVSDLDSEASRHVR